MSNLLCTDMIRIFKSKALYYGLFVSALLVFLFVLLNREDNMFAFIPEGGALCILPFFIGAVIGLNISSEFTSGAIRNKIVIGHRRRNIIASWTVCFSIVAALFFLVYEITAFFSAWLFSYDLSELDAEIVFSNLLTVLILIVSNMLLSLLVCIIIEDVRSVAVMFLMQFSLMAVSIVGGVALADNKMADILFRFYPQGQMNTLNIMTSPDKPWLTIICSTSLGISMFVLTIMYFRKHDMK